jgi:hypothetical protein
LGESDWKLVERSRGTVTKTRAGEGGSAGGFRFGAGSRGGGGLRGTSGHTAGGRSLLSSKVDVDGSSASFPLSPADDDDDAGAGGRVIRRRGGKGAVLMGGSAGRGSSAWGAIAASRITAELAVNQNQLLLVLGWGSNCKNEREGDRVKVGEEARRLLSSGALQWRRERDTNGMRPI